MTISPSLFEAFLKCPTKCFLRFTNEPPSGNAYAEWVQTENESYRAGAAEQLLAALPSNECANSLGSRREEAPYSAECLKSAKWRFAANVPARHDFGSSRGNEAQIGKSETNQTRLASAAMIETCLQAVERIPSAGRGQPAQFIPTRFIFRNKLTKNDRLLLGFDALVLSEMLGRAVQFGKIIHGDDHATLKVKTSALTGEVRKRIGKMNELLANPAPPDLVLNRHCAECEFQARCRKIAVEKDDLSLLAGMSVKERQKLRSKGIFTVTQLSYTFRPRRRPRRLRDKREKYHHALKALAIREKKIHIVGSPELKIEGTPVYLDVEGLPDRDFYYLIGLRIGNGDSAVQHSLWADTVADEGKIWREFLAILETVEKPVLVHYGSYETTFLKEMEDRHGGPQDESVTAKAVASAINLVSVMFAKIYFQTYSNSLKEIARQLNFAWSEIDASGTNSVAWRQNWENSNADILMHRLTTYNIEDCMALEMLVGKLIELPQSSSGANDSVLDGTVDITKLKWEHPYGFKRNKFVLPELVGINNAAYWDYQRDRVFLKSSSVLRRRSNRASRAKQTLAPNRTVECGRARICPKCASEKVVKHLKYGKTVIDLKFTRHGIKRWITRYQFHRYLCQHCGATFYPQERCWTRSKFGAEFIAYVLYLSIELRLPQIHVDHNLNKLFGFDWAEGAAQKIKIWSAKTYKDTYDALVKNLCNGQLLHADETKIGVRGTNAFVWIFANMEEVAYIYTETREGDFLQGMLKDFKGVLVSDFYAAYDAIPCPQQKCLIHLIRDLNDDLLKCPYDEELKRIAQSFTALLKPMVETIDRYGLKKRFLGKHLADVKRFYREISEMTMHSETAVKLKDRLEKNRCKLFTFLSFDGVPWNNNNAEHAVKPFAALRHVMGGITTEKGLREYLVLLSVCQTCKYMGVDFLDFLRSGEKDIHAFAESRRRGKRPTPVTPPPSLPPAATPSGGAPIS